MLLCSLDPSCSQCRVALFARRSWQTYGVSETKDRYYLVATPTHTGGGDARNEIIKHGVLSPSPLLC